MARKLGEFGGMRCPSCSSENPQGAKFCIDCAAPFGNRCPKCGFDNPARAKFCAECATPLSVGAVAPATSPRSQAPASYTPKHLAEKILTSRSALEGER